MMTNTQTMTMIETETLSTVATTAPVQQVLDMDSEHMVGKGVDFQRIRRITGYLVGTVDRFNNAKRAEVEDRVKHNVSRVVEL